MYVMSWSTSFGNESIPWWLYFGSMGGGQCHLLW